MTDALLFIAIHMIVRNMARPFHVKVVGMPSSRVPHTGKRERNKYGGCLTPTVSPYLPIVRILSARLTVC